MMTTSASRNCEKCNQRTLHTAERLGSYCMRHVKTRPRMYYYASTIMNEQPMMHEGCHISLA